MCYNYWKCVYLGYDLPSLYSSIPETWQVKPSTNQRLAKFILFRIQTWQVKLSTNQRLAKFIFLHTRNLASQTIYKSKTCQVYIPPLQNLASQTTYKSETCQVYNSHSKSKGQWLLAFLFAPWLFWCFCRILRWPFRLVSMIIARGSTARFSISYPPHNLLWHKAL